MPPRKPPDRRQGRGTNDAEVAPATAGAPWRYGRHRPPPPPHLPKQKLLAQTVTSWKTFWDSELAQLVLPADLPALQRLFRMYDARERLERTFMSKPFVDGSTGQLVAHPAAKVVASLDTAIDRLEPRFGITPKGRLELGVTFGAAAKSLEEMNRAFEEDDEDDDPRRKAIDTTGR